MKHLKRILPAALAFAMLLPAAPVFAGDLPGSAAHRAAEKLIESKTYFYNPSGVTLASGNDYPAEFDLRSADLDGSGVKKNYVTPVKNQGAFGTCWGFAATAAAETSILTDTGMSYDEWNDKMTWDMDLSEHHLAWFANMHLPDDGSDQGGEGIHFLDPNVSTGNVLDDGGKLTTATSVYSAGIDPAPEYMYPYRGKEGNIIYINDELEAAYEPKDGYEPYAYSDLDDWSLDETERFGTVYPLEESFLLPSPAQFEYDEAENKYNYIYNQAGTDAIKEQLMKGRPVTVAVAADTSTSEEISEYHYINPATWAHYVPLSINEDSADGEAASHCVTIVGWDDSFPKENFFEAPPGNGAWIVKNSWGSDESEFPNKFDWGDHGYFYISYYDHTISEAEALDFDVNDDENASGAYYSFKYDYMPAFQSYKHNIFDAPASMANTFENDDVEVTAKTLTFHTGAPNTETTFEMYMLSDRSTSPTDGELLAKGTKTYEYGGYHRFDLEEPVCIPANAKFSVVVTNKTADGKYEITNQEYESELTAKISEALYNAGGDYGRAVVNEGESFIKTTNEHNESEWADWADTIAEDKKISEAFLKKIQFMDMLEDTEAAREAYNSAADEYYKDHPKNEDEDIPEELEEVYDEWQSKGFLLNMFQMAIKNGMTAFFSPEDAADFSDAALWVTDNFPITVIAEPVKRDHILYYDSATSRLYTKMDYDTKEFSGPIDSFPGAICEGNKLTLTSDFQFVTTAKDGLFIDGNTTLYVPEGESPSIMSAADGFKGSDTLNEYTGIFAADGSTIDIDGTLTVKSGTGTDASGRAILSDGDLKITGNGSLEAICGNTEHDETAEVGRRDSLGIYIYGDLDISVANVRFIGGSAHGISFGIVTDEDRSLTISDGASVIAQGGKNSGEGDPYDEFYSGACQAGNLTVRDNSRLVASATEENDGDNYGLIILCGDVHGDGTIYDGSITLENNSSLTVNAEGSDRSFGIWSTISVPVEMDNTCTFTAKGSTKAAHYAKLTGVTAESADGEVLTYTRGEDNLTNSYVDANGNIAKYITFKNVKDIEVDYPLYFDGTTGKLYKYSFDPLTGEVTYSDPVEVKGAECEGNKLTLTSDFRFVTTYEDGLYLSDGATLHVPEGETPYIQSGADGFTRTETSNTTSGIFADGDCTFDIDGTLTVMSGNGVNTNSWSVICGGNMEITGTGTLNAFGGNISYDEDVLDSKTESIGICVLKNLDISGAEVNAYGGNAYFNSYGILTEQNCSTTIRDGARVTAEGGSSADTTGDSAAIGCVVGELVIKDNSSLTASSVRDRGMIHIGLRLDGDVTDNDGTIYKGRIRLENNSILTVRAANSANDYGIYLPDGPFGGAVKAEMDDTCTFTSDADVAGYAELKGVTAMSGENAVTFDSELGCYADADGDPIKSLSFRPTAEKSASAPAAHSSGGGSGKPKATATPKPAAAPDPGATENPGATTEPAAEPQSTAEPDNTEKSMPFTDVAESDWFYTPVKVVYAEGIMSGVSDTEFAPNAALTRGMLVTIIGRMGAAEAAPDASFADVDENAYYAPYIAWAAENGIVTGFDDGAFKPDEGVTREQTAAILYRYMKYIGATVWNGGSEGVSFNDAGEISEYAVPAVTWAYESGVLKGYPDGTFAPKADITRAEFASIISAIALL